jgi:hypothetical protein
MERGFLHQFCNVEKSSCDSGTIKKEIPSGSNTIKWKLQKKRSDKILGPNLLLAPIALTSSPPSSGVAAPLIVLPLCFFRAGVMFKFCSAGCNGPSIYETRI